MTGALPWRDMRKVSKSGVIESSLDRHGKTTPIGDSRQPDVFTWRIGRRGKATVPRRGRAAGSGLGQLVVRSCLLAYDSSRGQRDRLPQNKLHRRSTKGFRTKLELCERASSVGLGAGAFPITFVPVYPSATTGLTRFPIPVRCTSTISPGFMLSVAPSVPIQIMSRG